MIRSSVMLVEVKSGNGTDMPILTRNAPTIEEMASMLARISISQMAR